jgi:hypothetical protein
MSLSHRPFLDVSVSVPGRVFASLSFGQRSAFLCRAPPLRLRHQRLVVFNVTRIYRGSLGVVLDLTSQSVHSGN